MLISVISVSEPMGKTSKGGKPYTAIELEYEANGNTNTKPIVDFADYYDILKDSHPGDMFEVEVKKDGKYYQWVTVSEASSAGTSSRENSSTSKPNRGAKDFGGKARPAGTYETPEERAFRQELIVMQSSVTAALKLLELNLHGDSYIKPEQVTELALYFRDVVYRVKREVTPRVE